jgi:MFS family permease
LTTPAGQAPQEQQRRGWIDLRLALSMHLPSISLGFGLGATVVVMAELSLSFGQSAAVAMLIFILHQLGTTVAPAPTGFLIDRIGRRKMLLAGPFVIAASSMLTVRALVMDGTFVEILVYQFTAGIGEQMWMLSRITLIAETGRAEQRGRQITSMFGVQQVGNLTGPIIGGLTADQLGLWVPFLLQGIVVVIGVIPSFFLIKETLVRKPGGAGSARAGSGLTWQDLRKPPIPYVFATQFLANVTRGSVFGGGVFVLYAGYAYDFSPTTIGALRSAMGLVGIPITFAAGYIMDTYGRKYTIVPGLLLSGLAMAFMALTDALSVHESVFITAFIAVHVAVSLISGNMQTLGTDVAPTHARGAFFGWSRTISQGGSLVSQASVTPMLVLAGYTGVFALFAFTAMAAGFIVLLAIPETLKKEKPAETPAPEPAEGSGGSAPPR